MNDKLKKLRDKARAIDAPAEAGADVKINLSNAGETKEVVVNEATGEIPVEAIPAGAKTREINVVTNEEEFDIDFDSIELTGADVNEIMQRAVARTPRAIDRNISPLPVVNVNFDAAENVWHLANDCVYTTDNGWTITAKAGFAFDLASVPRILWILISSFDLSLIGPLYHDLLYRNGGVLSDDLLTPVKNPTHRFEREDADDILNELMEKSGVPTWKRLAAYRAVRLFSGFAWKD